MKKGTGVEIFLIMKVHPDSLILGVGFIRGGDKTDTLCPSRVLKKVLRHLKIKCSPRFKHDGKVLKIFRRLTVASLCAGNFLSIVAHRTF